MDVDGLEVLSVRPFHSRTGTAGDWPCRSCGGPHDVSESWNVTWHRHGELTSMIVCPACAQRARAQRRLPGEATS